MKLLQHDKSNNSALSARHSYLLNNVHSDELRVIITGGILGVHLHSLHRCHTNIILRIEGSSTKWHYHPMFKQVVINNRNNKDSRPPRCLFQAGRVRRSLVLIQVHDLAHTVTSPVLSVTRGVFSASDPHLLLVWCVRIDNEARSLTSLWFLRRITRMNGSRCGKWFRVGVVSGVVGDVREQS